jgi:UDP-N-acetylglucosamine--N-acetylmuramyl-(pentapeptide) pyrophosphoryl-undecaprenol N-acetylglucosamine transferase
VYPALAVLQELDGDDLELLWVGGEGGMEEELVTRAGLNFTTLPAAGLHGIGVSALPRNLLQLWRGVRAARGVLADFNPDVLFFTGGFVAAPVALAGRQIPTVAFVPDMRPGFALRLVARFADHIAVIASEAGQYFSRTERLSVTGYPVRAELLKWRRERARSHFGLDDALPTLLAFGGSKGALSINRALVQALPDLLPHMQILHVTGTLTWPEVRRRSQSFLQAWPPITWPIPTCTMRWARPWLLLTWWSHEQGRQPWVNSPLLR